MRSFRSTLTLVIWIAAIIPVLLLSFQYYRTSVTKLEELAQQQLAYEANQQALLFKNQLEDSFLELDAIASDGSVITSSVIDMLSTKAVKQLEGFLAQYSFYENLMIVDETLFQVEAVPNSALAIDLSPFAHFVDEMFRTKESINQPSSKIFIVEDESAKGKYLIAIARPILQPKESITNPFEVTSVLFSVLSFDKFVSNLFMSIDKPIEDIDIEIYRDNQKILSLRTREQSLSNFMHEVEIPIKNNSPFIVKAGLKSELSYSLNELIGISYNQFLVMLMFFVSILLLASYFTKKLVQPVNEIKALTEQITQSGFAQYTPICVREARFYREFSELTSLLDTMWLKMCEQFSELNDKNAKLETMTSTLQSKVSESDFQNEVLQNLMDFELFIKQHSSIEGIGCLALGVAYTILNSPVGIMIYRTSAQSGFKSLDRAPKEFLSRVNNEYKLTLTEIKQYELQHENFLIIPIMDAHKLRGYLVCECCKSHSFKKRSLDILASLLQAFLNEQRLRYELLEMANTDALTKLNNRYFFDKKLAEVIESHQENHTNFGILIIDVNGLKVVNDTYGHDAGDTLLTFVSDYLKSKLRASDIIARLGGDEFAVIVKDVTSQCCQELSTKLMSQLSSHTIRIKHDIIQPSFSCGYACSDSDDAQEVLFLADQRMYKIKMSTKT